MAKVEYPRWKYHATKPACVVYSAKEERDLGRGWADSPADFEAKEEPVKEVEPVFVTEPPAPEEVSTQPGE